MIWDIFHDVCFVVGAVVMAALTGFGVGFAIYKLILTPIWGVL